MFWTVKVEMIAGNYEGSCPISGLFINRIQKTFSRRNHKARPRRFTAHPKTKERMCRLFIFLFELPVLKYFQR